jgi:hypothetical protein
LSDKLSRGFIVALTVLNVTACGYSMTGPSIAQSEAKTWTLAARSLLPIPVPSFTPTADRQVIGVDAYPSPGAEPDPDNGYSWFDACDANLMHSKGDTPVTCARMGIKADRVEFGSREFDGGAQKDVYIIRGKEVLARFGADGLTVYGPVTAKEFRVQP